MKKKILFFILFSILGIMFGENFEIKFIAEDGTYSTLTFDNSAEWIVVDGNKLPIKNCEKKLIKRIKHKNYPQEKEIIYHDLDTIYKLYTGLKFNKFQTNKIITTIINNSKIEMKTVKIGTILGDVINEENLSTEIYLISKNKVKKVNNFSNFVITDDIDGIIV